jgi:hypothetical protein
MEEADVMIALLVVLYGNPAVFSLDLQFKGKIQSQLTVQNERGFLFVLSKDLFFQWEKEFNKEVEHGFSIMVYRKCQELRLQQSLRRT